jgi:hypothetical protein
MFAMCCTSIRETKEAKREPNDPGLDRILRAAVKHDFPVNILCWANVDAGTALIDRQPDTRRTRRPSAQAVSLEERLNGLLVVDDGVGACPVRAPQAAVATPGIEHAGKRSQMSGNGYSSRDSVQAPLTLITAFFWAVGVRGCRIPKWSMMKPKAYGWSPQKG